MRDLSRLNLAGYAVAVVLVIAAIAWWAAGSAIAAEREAARARVQAEAIAIADGISLDRDDAVVLNERLARIGAADPGGGEILVLRTTGNAHEVVADWAGARAPRPAGTLVDVEREVAPPGSIVGTGAIGGPQGELGRVIVRADERSLGRHVRDAITGALAIVLIAVGALLLPLVALRRPETVRSSPTPVPEDRSVMGRRFEVLAKGMQERHYVRQTFGRYVSQRVAEVLAAEHAGLAAPTEARDATVVRGELDPAGLAAASADPSLVVGVINEWIAAMVDLVDQHGGTVSEQHGDGFVAVFGAPSVVADHAQRAVACAIAMRKRSQALNREWEKTGRAKAWQEAGIPTLGPRLGVHSGRVIAGNIGSAMRMRYGVVGEAVDRALDVERRAAESGTDVLITESVVQAVPSGSVRTIDQGRVGALAVFGLA